MIESSQAKIKNQKSGIGNLFINYKPRLRRRLLTFGLQAAMKLLFHIESVGWEHVPASGGLILMINHIAFLDPVLLTGLFPRPIISMAKAEALDEKIVGPLIKSFDAFPVNRGTGDRQALRTAFEVLAAGLPLLIAPEGHRSESVTLGEAHEGIAFIASRSQVPVVPVGISGTDQFKHNFKRWRRTPAIYRFGKPFILDAGDERASSDVLKRMTDEAMYQLASLLPLEQRGIYSNAEAMTTQYVRFV
ncbi:MAG TPA: lysophospholipid acyltransferase family protein [Anaerolineae bacterium]|nr:lysophospholipid acyltransferase family protein [Anaerolineae bacterium]